MQPGPDRQRNRGDRETQDNADSCFLFKTWIRPGRAQMPERLEAQGHRSGRDAQPAEDGKHIQQFVVALSDYATQVNDSKKTGERYPT